VTESPSHNESCGVIDYSNLTPAYSRVDILNAESVNPLLGDQYAPPSIDDSVSHREQIHDQHENINELIQEIEVRTNSRGISIPSICIRTACGKILRSVKELKEYLKDVQKQGKSLPFDPAMDLYTSFRHIIRSLAFNESQYASKPVPIKNVKFTKCKSNANDELYTERVNLRPKVISKYPMLTPNKSLNCSKSREYTRKSDKILALKQKALVQRKEQRMINCAYKSCEKKFTCISLYKTHIAISHVSKQLFHQAQNMVNKKVCPWCEMIIKAGSRIEIQRFAIHIGVTHNQILAYVIPEVNRQILSHLRLKKQAKKKIKPVPVLKMI